MKSFQGTIVRFWDTGRCWNIKIRLDSGAELVAHVNDDTLTRLGARPLKGKLVKGYVLESCGLVQELELA